ASAAEAPSADDAVLAEGTLDAVEQEDTADEAAEEPAAADTPVADAAAEESTTDEAPSDEVATDEATTDEATTDEAAAEGQAVDEPATDPVQEFKDMLASQYGEWYVVHSYAGYENRVKVNLENRITSLNMEDYIFQVEVPME